MTKRFRALAVSGLLLLSFNFAGCFDWGGEPCDLEPKAQLVVEPCQTA